MKEQLEKAEHPQSRAIRDRHTDVMRRWRPDHYMFCLSTQPPPQLYFELYQQCVHFIPRLQTFVVVAASSYSVHLLHSLQVGEAAERLGGTQGSASQSSGTIQEGKNMLSRLLQLLQLTHSCPVVHTPTPPGILLVSCPVVHTPTPPGVLLISCPVVYTPTPPGVWMTWHKTTNLFWYLFLCAAD